MAGTVKELLQEGKVKHFGLSEIGATSIELTADDLRDIDDAVSRMAIQGNRCPETIEQRSGR